MRYLLYFVLILTSLNYRGFSQAYEPLAENPIPEKVSNNAVVGASYNDTFCVYTFSGLDSTKVWSGLHLRSYRYNTVSGAWDSIPSLPDTLGKIAAGASVVGDTIYIIGGYYVYQNGNEATSAHVHRYDISNNAFLPDGAPVPVPVDDQVQVVWRDSLIILVTGWSNTTNVPDVQIYNPFTNTWSIGTSVPNTNAYKSFGASGAILGDTLYYFGGARSSGSFGPQYEFRKGYIDPNDPANISWALTWFDLGVRGYRMASFSTSDGFLHWIGGSYQTYNYNGFAYNGSGGVPPIDRNLIVEPSSGRWEEEYSYEYPMDLRGIAKLSDSILYLAGGMSKNQKVTNEVWRLEKRPFMFNSLDPIRNRHQWNIYPNPAQGKVQIIGDPKFERGRILDFNGREILRIDSEVRTIGIQDLPAGIYFLQLDHQTQKLIINN